MFRALRLKETTWLNRYTVREGLSTVAELVTSRSSRTTPFQTLQCKARVSGCLESIVLKVTRDGDEFTELAVFYTHGSAERNGILRKPVSPGKNRMEPKRMVSERAIQAAEWLLLRCGWDLMKGPGRGSYCFVIHVRSDELYFAVKIGTEGYDSSKRLSVLLEAVVMDIALKQPEYVGIFCHKAGNWLWTESERVCPSPHFWRAANGCCGNGA